MFAAFKVVYVYLAKLLYPKDYMFLGYLRSLQFLAEYGDFDFVFCCLQLVKAFLCRSIKQTLLYGVNSGVRQCNFQSAKYTLTPCPKVKRLTYAVKKTNIL